MQASQGDENLKTEEGGEEDYNGPKEEEKEKSNALSFLWFDFLLFYRRDVGEG